MKSTNKITYQIHIPIIVGLLVLHYFSSDIFNHFYLRAAEKKFAAKDGTNGIFFPAGEYKKIRENIPCEIVPCDSLFVFVESAENSVTETHFTEDGTKTIAYFVNDKWVRSSHHQLSGQLYFLVPLAGFILCGIAAIHDILRTKTLFSWNVGKAPDLTEKALYIYGCPLLGLGIILVIIKEHWMKFMN